MENQGRVPDASEAGAILKAVCGDAAHVKGKQMYCIPCPEFTSLHGLTTERFELRWVLARRFFRAGQRRTWRYSFAGASC